MTGDPLGFLRTQAAWLGEPALGTCLVGSHALAIACARAGVSGPQPADLDLAWALDPATGAALLRQHGVFVATTDNNVQRGTLAMKLAGQRIEVTTFRGGPADAPQPQRIRADLLARDMSIGAVGVRLADGTVHDPANGVADWQLRRIAVPGEPADRIREHPARWLRYYRKAHQLGFTLDRRVRSLAPDPALLATIPPEAIAQEFRAALQQAASPGRFFLDLHETGLLPHVAPELAPQFDGRPAGPQRHHPEVGQALHLILALEWAVDRCRELPPQDRHAVLVAVLCHDLGKGLTPPDELPGHPAHEHRGAKLVTALLDRLPGLADARTRTLALTMCELHLELRRLRAMRSGTLARLYDRWLRTRDLPVDLLALAVGADVGGRLGLAASGDTAREQVAADVHRLRNACDSVDAAALRAQHPDLERFREALHRERCRAIATAFARAADD